MIIGLGIDTVDIARFSQWHTYSAKQLQKILSPEEIDYCMAISQLASQRFAIRFAAREAFFKAWNSAFPENYIPFLTCCKSLAIRSGKNGEPMIAINWKLLGHTQPLFSSLISLTHTSSVATACILLQKIQYE